MLFKSIFSLLLFIPFVLSAQFVDPESKDYKAYYYDDGSISSEGTLVNGKPDQYWITYYPNGLRKSEGNRLDFELSGEWKFYDKEGNLNNSIEYSKGIKSGFSRNYSNCFLSEELEYLDGIQIGIHKEFYPDSSNSLVKSSIPYDNGKKNGLGYLYAKDGRTVEILTYKNGFLVNREKVNQKDDEGKNQGTWKEYYSNGRLKTEMRYKDDYLNGYVKKYNSKGKLEEAELYLGGEKQSDEENNADFEIVYTYYDDGSIKSATTYNLAGKKDGVSQFYERDGLVIRSEVYEDDYLIAKGLINNAGVKNGFWEDYYLNGNIKSKGEYKSGNKYGKWEYFFISGQKEQEGYFDKAGRYTSKWTWYYENGNILRTEEFLKGLEDGMLVEYDIESNVITEGELLEGEKEGEWYYSLNDHTEVGKYLYGERNGYWIHTYPNGKTSFEGSYESGRPQGRHKYYNEKGVLIKEENYSYGVQDGKWKWFDDNGVEYMTILYKDGQEKKVNGTKFKVETKE